MGNETFTDVAGQSVQVARPPAGSVVVVDTNGTYTFVSNELLRETRVGSVVLDQLLRAKSQESTAERERAT